MCHVVKHRVRTATVRVTLLYITLLTYLLAYIFISNNVNPLTPTVAICNFWHPGALTLSHASQSAVFFTSDSFTAITLRLHLIRYDTIEETVPDFNDTVAEKVGLFTCISGEEMAYLVRSPCRRCRWCGERRWPSVQWGERSFDLDHPRSAASAYLRPR